VAKNKKRIAWDIDGVLGMFIEDLFDEYNHMRVDEERRGGRKRDVIYTPDMMIKPQLHDVFPMQIAEEMYHIFNSPGFYARLRPYAGAVDLVNATIDAGYESFILTSPSNHFVAKHRVRAINPHSAAGKIEWVVNHWPRLGRLITLTKQKEYVFADFIVEDTPDNVIKWCARHPEGVGILIDRPWNQHAELPSNAVRTPLNKVFEVIKANS
jgi:5'(3')-deoxyribonucleotidase